MTSTSSQNASGKREDFSRFIVHLTRDDTDTFKNGSSARENFISILKSKEILCSRPHCLYNKQLTKLSEELRDKFNVSCFTEVPLSQIHLLTKKIEGRQIELSPYGLVFSKEFIVKNGGQPAIYVNSYSGQDWIRQSVDRLFKVSLNEETLDDPLWRLLPLINAMHEKCDFSWEREWRFCRSFNFEIKDLVCVILPEMGEDKLKEQSSKAGLAVISPGWTYEQIISELASQQRMTKKLTLEGIEIKQKEAKDA